MSIVIRFVGDAGPFLDGVKKVKKGLGDVSSDVRKNANDFVKWGAGAAAAAAAAGLAITKHASSSAKEIQNLSRIANASVVEFQGMAFAAKSVGIENDKLSDILKDVGDRVGDFLKTGGGPMADFFEKIAPKVGVTAQQFKNLSGPQALQLFYDSLQKANLSQSEMIFFMESMASDATALIPLLKDGGKAFKEQAAQAKELGFILSEFDIQRLVEMDKRFARITGQTEAAKNQIALGLLPVIEKVADAFIEAGNQAGGLEKTTHKALINIAKGADFAIDSVNGLKVAWKAVQLGAAAAGFAAISLAETAIKSGAKLLDYFLTIPREISIAISKIPGVDIAIPEVSKSKFISDLGELSDVAAGTVMELSKELHNMAMSATSSTLIEDFVSDAIAAAETAKAAIANVTQPTEEDGSTPQLSGVDALTEEQRKQRMELLRTGLVEEEELRTAQYAREIEQLNEFYEGKIGLEDEWREEIKKREQQFTQDLYNIRREGTDSIENLLKTHYGWQAEELYRSGKDALGAMAQHSKKAFELNKKVSLAEAGIKGVKSAINAWEAGMSTGGPWAPVVAAAYTAASLAKTGAMIQSIRSQQYGSGGSQAVSSSGGGTAAVSAAQAQTQQPAAAPSTVANISIAGGDMFSRDSVIALANAMSDLAADGVTAFNIT